MKKFFSALIVSLLLCSSVTTFAISYTNAKATKVVVEKTAASYVDYETGIIGTLVKSGKTVILFFHADRCPTCVSLDKDIKNNLKDIPSHLVIVKVNYDTAKNLKKLYKVKSQNSLVVINKKGKIVARSKGATTTLKDALKLVK